MRLNNSIFEKFRVPHKLTKLIKDTIPLSTRKKVKSYFGKFLVPATEIIPIEISKEWSNNNTSKADILIFSVISWDLRFQRPQQLAQEFAKAGHRVFYIEHEFLSYSNSKSKFAPIQVTKKGSNIYQITISASRELFIYQENPSPVDKNTILSSIRNLINQANIINPIAKIDHPFWAFITDKLAMPIIYDCMDNHLGFSDSGKDIAKLEKELIKKANQIVTTSKYLTNKVSSPNKTTLIANAADYSHFHNKTNTIPKELKNIPHPIIGYYGAISHWFDVPLLKKALYDHPDKSFVLIGKLENKEVENLNFKNLYLLGEKLYQELPNYLHQFDLTLIPFLLTPLIKATNPVKIFEYFAAGKPVVSTKLPELYPFSKEIFFANQENISRQITKALLDKNKTSKYKIAHNNTWHHRYQSFKEIIDSFFPKVSIIILSYQHPDLLKKTIDSVIERSFYPNLEIIIVDNNSNQETINLLNLYKKSQNVKLIFNKENYGFAKGNNIGLKIATGEYLVLLNNDVIVTPGWISHLLFHVQKPNVGLVGAITNSIGNEALVHIEYDYNNQKDLESSARNYTTSHWGETLEVNNIAAFCWIMSNKTYQAIGDLDERFERGMFEDDDFCKRIKKNKLKTLIADDVFVHHFGGSSFKEISPPDYKNLFEENKKKFESKWHQKWIPHQYRK
ncbi:MAG: Glycosyl transferase family 2 [Candidatus Shapirobacteria bacterium GW2011_GWE1_38_92]|uniref:Glycosyl transferase family 2 n=3 Tax=Candidatus Shapironibacteriota TaxID=1752721 RepID=A0A0G0K7B3_9BACT|nr:MAG: Glycosyl transferase family 2 [Candidatus Shapirobacteria bacterium GW2011_GWE2_38_30]KKQ92822.1 MAG: Glycosyl transferase family 2 [Candidatus Shapirobacteria bacterium GW2011_GWE1_38_92]OGL56326.1 MAG: hypothetical protein A2367_03445 [Candidatus Shapirobacteria bacterium RIFOXYB1_FULL_38_38]